MYCILVTGIPAAGKLDLDKSLNEINQLINGFTTEKSV